VGQHGHLVLVQDLGPQGHLQHDVLARAAGLLAAHAGLAGPGEEMLLVAVVDQGVQPFHRLGPDRSAPAAIAAVRAAEFDELLAPERDAARPAAARADIDFGKVEEFHGAAFKGMKRRYRIGGAGSSKAWEFSPPVAAAGTCGTAPAPA